MLWFWIVIVGYLLNAVSTLISKWLLSHDLPHPVVYTFYIGVLNLLALVLIPFGFYYPGFSESMLALCSGVLFGLGLFCMNIALNKDQVSQVAPMVGGLQPIVVMAFAWWFLPEQLNFSQYVGVVFLVLGSIFIALEIGRKRIFTESLWYIMLSAFFFGTSYASLKLVYLQQSFVSGFVWSRIGMFLFVVILATFTRKWMLIKKDLTQSKQKQQATGWFVLAQALGAIAFVTIAYAISRGPVTIINALQGLQYAFIFVVVLALYKKHPKLLLEPMNRNIIIQKSIATLLIIIGLALVV